MAITAASLEVRFNSSGADRVKGDLRDLQSATDSANSGFQKLQNSILGIGTAFLPVIGAGVRFNVDLEQQMANVNASLGGIDTSKLEELEQGFIDIGSASQFSAVEVAAVGDELAKAGFDPSQIIATTEAVVDLSQATDTDLMTSVSGITAVMSLWKEEIVGTELALTSATEAADIYTAAANASSASVGDIISGVRNFGPTAAGLRISFNETAGAIAFFTTNGLKAADSGVSLTRMIEDLQNPTAEAAALMDEFNITLFDMQGNFVGLPALFDQLNTAFGDMDPKARQAALSVLFGAESLDVATIAAANGGDPLREIIKLTEQHGIAAEQSAMRMDTLKAQFGELVESTISLTGQLVSGLMPGLRGVVDIANVAVNAMSRIPQPILSAVGAIGALAAAFATLKGAAAGIAFLSRLTGMNLPGGALLAGLATPLLAVAAAAGVAYAAFRFNLFGIGDIVRKTARTFVDGFTDMWDSLETVIDGTETVAYRFRGMTFTYTTAAGEVIALTNTVSRVFFALGAGFRAIGWETVADGMDAVARTTETLIQTFRFATNVFTDLLDAGINPVSAALRTLGTIVPAVSEVTTALSGAFTNLLGAWTMLRAGEWSMAFSNLRMAADLAWIAVQEIGSGLGGLVVNLWDWTLNVGVPAVTGWIVDAAGDVWSAISTAAGWAWDGLVTLGAWTLNTAAPTVIGWIQFAAGAVWETLKTLVGWTWGTSQDLGAWVLNTAAPTVIGWIQFAAGDVWGTLKTLTGWAWGEAQDLGDWTLNTAAPTITGWLSDAASIASTLKAMIVAGVNALNITSTDLMRIGTQIVSAIGEAVPLALQGAVDWTADFYTWIADTLDGVEWNAVGSVIGEGLGKAIRYALGTLVVGGVLQGQLFNWIGGALLNVDWMGLAQAVGQALLSMIGAAVQFAQGFVAGLFKGLFDPIADELEGVLTRIKDQINDVIAFSNENLGTNFDFFDTPTRRAQEFSEAMESVRTSMRNALTEAAGVTGRMQQQVDTSLNQPVGAQPVPPSVPGQTQARVNGLPQLLQGLQQAAEATIAWTAANDALGESHRGVEVTGDRLQRLIESIAAQQEIGATNAYDHAGALDVLRENSVGAGVGVTLFGESALRAVSQVQTLGSEAVALGAAITAMPPATIMIDGDNAGALAAVDGAASALGGINGQIAQTFVNGDPSGAIGAVGAAMGALASVDGFVATAYIEAVNNVGGAVGAAAAALMSIDGMTATTYINVVSTGGAGFGAAVPRAGGGLVTEPYTLVGEFGPELVSLPYGSYVHTAAETRAMQAEGIAPPRSRESGGASREETHIHHHYHIERAYGIDDLAGQIWEMGLTSMADEEHRHRVAVGVA